MAFSYDVSTDRGKVRLLSVDTKSDDYVFEDDEIDTFITLESSNIRRAAALALETIASNENMVLKKIQSLDLTTDGPSTSREFRERAKDLREQAKEAESRESTGAFDIAEQVFDPFTRRERWWNQVQRNEVSS